MKIVSKLGYKFATGMFWQIPDEGKRNLNFAKIVKDTKHNMFCHIKTINPTWGFCHKTDMNGEKKIASLGKFIIEASKLSASYANSIICFKFKKTGELDDNGGVLDKDLYGYIVLINGTISPDEGEYVANLEMIRESIKNQAKKYEIETLYLPLDVAGSFFSIFELLADNIQNIELLLKIIQNISVEHKRDLIYFIKNELPNSEYTRLLSNQIESNLDTEILIKLIKEPKFESKLKDFREYQIKYLIENIYIVGLTSDEIYWQEDKCRKLFKSSLLQSISSKNANRYKLVILLLLLVVGGYSFYKMMTPEPQVVAHKLIALPVVVKKPQAVLPEKLVASCLKDNDRFFKDLGQWSLSAIKCDSLGAIFTFDSVSDTTFGQFKQLIGTENTRNLRLNNKTGTYFINYKLAGYKESSSISDDYVLNNLQQGAINYGFKLNIIQNSAPIAFANTKTHQTVKFSINSKLSPLFLLNHGIFGGVKLNEINMVFDKVNGFPNWSITGEY